MRGQFLFVRPIEPDDHDSIRDFLLSHGGPPHVPACGLIGKLVGNLVAVIEMQITADAVQVDNIVVARELRRKRVARVMLNELEHLAARMDRRRIVAEDGVERQEFLSRVGFEREGVSWIRRVRA